MLCSKVFGKVGRDLAEEVAILARRLCIGDIDNDHIRSIEACRLVPLIKDVDGVRPIGIGEVVRRGGSEANYWKMCFQPSEARYPKSLWYTANMLRTRIWC